MKLKIVYITSILAVVVLAFFLRIYKVTEDPPSLNWDEVSIAYNAYSILKTGRDEWGQYLPLHFKAYGEYKLPAQIYASIPGIYFFGLNELGVRITPVVYGTLSVLVLFILTRALFNSKVGLMAALLLAISPWHIQLTRASFESSFSVVWIMLGVWFFVKGLADRKWLVFSMIPFAVSVYTYNSARVFSPLFIVLLIFIFRKILFPNYKILIITLLAFGILLLPLLPFFVGGEGKARYKLVSISDDPGLVPRINENRGRSKLPEPFTTLVHNRFSYIGVSVAEHYLAHFTPNFLFISGAPHKQHHVQEMGELYKIQAPFLLLGLYLLFRKKSNFGWSLVGWVLLGFIPVSLTNDSIPHALRTLLVNPALQIMTALGVYEACVLIKNQKQRTLMLGILALVLSIEVTLYLQNYYQKYPVLYSRDWQYGYKQAVDYIKQNSGKYDEIVFTRSYGEPHMFTLFFTGYDPLKYQNNPTLNRFETYDWVRVLRFDNYYFPDLSDKGTRYEDIIDQQKDKKILFIGKPGDFPQNVNTRETINFLNGDQAFKVVSYP